MKKTQINKFQLDQIVFYLKNNYIAFGTHKHNGKIVFGRIKESYSYYENNTAMSFKKALLPNPAGFEPGQKIALIGLHNCDLHSLNRMLADFSNVRLLPAREDIFIVGASCKPEEECFCDMIGTNKPIDFDLYLQKSKNGYELFSGSKKGDLLFKMLKLKNILNLSIKDPQSTDNPKKINQSELKKIIENRDDNQDFWQALANNCFGCGACTAVCPLCFCVRQDFANDTEGGCTQCLKWDSCFAERFSQIQNHHDFRPSNKDRLYNWYHHKFVRSPYQNQYSLCTGCGRCITACPAHLNIKNILNSLIEKNEETT